MHACMHACGSTCHFKCVEVREQLWELVFLLPPLCGLQGSPGVHKHFQPVSRLTGLVHPLLFLFLLLLLDVCMSYTVLAPIQERDLGERNRLGGGGVGSELHTHLS